MAYIFIYYILLYILYICICFNIYICIYNFLHFYIFIYGVLRHLNGLGLTVPHKFLSFH